VQREPGVLRQPGLHVGMRVGALLHWLVGLGGMRLLA